MSDSRAVVQQNNDLATMPIEQALEAYTPNFEAVLPPQVSVDHFKRMVVTALNTTPSLANADRRTLFNACVKCASDGLLPDGREAALVVYRTKVKDRQGREQWIEAVQFMPMIAGIRKRLRNTGEVHSAVAEVVYRNDRFKYSLGDKSFIEHDPPPLDQERGDPVGAYAIIRLSSGEVIREVMGLQEIERARSVSRAKDKGPWVDWWGEMARKTVLRRAAKSAPQASMLERLLQRDDEEPMLPSPEEFASAPPRPQRSQFAPAIHVVEQPEPWEVVDMTGTVAEYATSDAAVEGYQAALDEAERQKGEDGLTTVWDNNQHLMNRLDAEDMPEVSKALSNEYGERRRAIAASAPSIPPAGDPSPTAPQSAQEKGAGIVGELSKATQQPAGGPAPRGADELRGSAAEHPGEDAGSHPAPRQGEPTLPIDAAPNKLGLGIPQEEPTLDERRAARTHPFWHQRQSKRTLPENRDEFLAQLPLRLAECLDWAETDDIERHNAGFLRTLSADDRVAVAAHFARRREQLRGT